jgi:hypothetical protein
MLKLVKLSFVYAILRRLYVTLFIIQFLELILLADKTTSYLANAPIAAVTALLGTFNCWIIIKLINVIMIIKLNPYVCINRFTKSIYMDIKYFKRSSDLINGFMNGLLAIPVRYINKDFRTSTHEYICISLIRLLKKKGAAASIVYQYIEKHNKTLKVLDKCIITLENNVEHEILFKFKKKDYLIEKVFHYNSIIKYLKNVKAVEHKVNKYKVVIPRELILSLVNTN